MELPRLTVLNERFAIRSVLGELGPFEATYLAWDLENEEQVVVREYLPLDFAVRDEKGIGLFPESDDEEQLFKYGLERIAKEAQLFGNINHPNVVREREHFRENGTIYRILDYHAGASLSYVLQQQGGKVAARTAVTILMPLMDGIRAGHMQGLVHGAISPDTIYLTKTGRPMLLSFKTSHLLLAQRTQNLNALQQPGFSPPEQYTPRGKHGPWSDVYGCGATLFTMLSGQQLPDVPARLREDVVPALIDQAFELSLGTRNALKAALDMNITRRPQTIDAFRTMLVDGFNLSGAHVPPPDEQPAKEAYRRQSRVATPQPAEDAQTLTPPDETEPLHFAVKGKKAPRSAPITKQSPKQPLSVEELHFGDTAPQGDGGGVMERSSHGQTTLAEQYQTSVAELSPVSQPLAPAQDNKATVFDRKQAIREEAWEKNRDYAPGRNLTLQRTNRKRIFLGLAIGGIIALSLMAYNYFDSRDPVSYEIGNSGYAMALLKGDSLYTLAEDVMETDNWESARLLFVRARENYSVALTLSNGDKKTLRQRIDSVDAYLSVPIEVELDEKASLAFISRGDSVMRVAESLNLVGDSVAARTLFMKARGEYLKVLEDHPDDSLALARVREASQRMVTPVRVETPASIQLASDTERLRQLYMQLKIKGDSAFDANSLTLARARFVEALTYKPEDPHASRRIAQIDQRLADSERQGQYRQYMNSGNRLKSAGRLDEARREFEFAMQFKPNDDEASAAIFEITSIQGQQLKRENDYQSHKTRGDVLLEKEDYQGALESYQSALVAKPDDKFASQKLKEIRETLSALEESGDELPEGMVDDNGIYNFTEEPPVLVGGREVLQSRLRYPPKAVEAGIEGRVSVRMIVDETGRMLDPTIQKGIRFDLDDEVLRVIRGARFEPGRVGGQPVKSWYTLFFEFKLDNE